jgi:hypothetical protein
MKKLIIILFFSITFSVHAQEYVSLYEQLVSARGTSTVTVTEDTMLSVPITIAIALSLTLKGDKEGRTILGTGYTEDDFSKPSYLIVERGVTLILENIALFGVYVHVKQGGTLVMNNGATITGCLSCGVYVEGTFTMNKGSSITNNGSSGVIISGGIFTMNDGIIAANKDYWGGGVNIDSKGTFNMLNGLIENNTASEQGGGVFLKNNSSFNMQGGRIENNTASGHGGGVFVNINSSFNMQDGVIAKNRTDKNGGGVYIGANGIFRMTGGVIHGSGSNNLDANTAKAGKAVYNDSVRRDKEYNSTVTKF